VVYSGFGLCLAIALAVTLAALALKSQIAALFPRVPDLETAWLMAAPGLLFFAANKYLLGVVNGLQHMRAFAVFQITRFVGILVGLALMIVAGAAGKYLALILTIAEVLLSVALVAYVVRAVPPVMLSGLISAMRRHFRFGLRILPAGLVAELNTRVDVLMLGALMNDRAVGIYTVAALVYEAALQAIVVLRNNISPQLARDIKENAADRILSFSRKLGVLVTVVMVTGAAIGLALFPLFLEIVFPSKDFAEATPPLAWLMAALCVAAGPLCYSLIFSQADKPGWQSIVMLVMLSFNIALNLILIPLLGIAGAGIATGASAIIGAIAIVVLSRSVLGIRLFV
jgi:stage V sporulation protein B